MWGTNKIIHRTITLGHMHLDKLVFNLAESPLSVTERRVRGWASVYTHITDVFVMHRVVKREVLEFIITSGKMKYIILCE